MRATKHHSYRCAELCFFFLSGGGKVGSLVFMLQVFVSIDSFPTGELTQSTFFLDQNCNCNWFPSWQVVTVLFLSAICYNRKHVRPFRCATWIYIYILYRFSKDDLCNQQIHAIRNPTDLGPNRKWLWLYFMYRNSSSIWSRSAAWRLFRHDLRDFHVWFRWIDWIHWNYRVLEIKSMKL